MIVDTITNAGRYAGLGERLARGLALLSTEDFLGKQPGKYEVDGAQLYYLVQSSTTKPKEQGKWESHRSYIDIQCVVDGAELMLWAPTARLSVTQQYDPVKDVIRYAGLGDCILARAGTFLVFWPEDGHMPGIAVHAPAPVRKVVVKIRL
jgi:YhcH/YjgK/YiaL family protein